MKKPAYFCCAIFLVSFGCGGTTLSEKNTTPQTEVHSEARADASENAGKPIDTSTIFTLMDAEKIMGESARLSDRKSSVNSNISEYQCAYTANDKDDKTSKQGVIYFMYEDYPQATAAHDAYIGIMKANEANGISALSGVGDEAYFHTDNQNFYFMLARKGTRMIRVKVNKITANTSLDEFNRITQDITNKL